MRQTMRPRKPREWAGPMGSVCGDIEEDGRRTAHVRLPHAVFTATECRIMASWMLRAAEWIDSQKEEGR
jgi:hypothetical protein